MCTVFGVLQGVHWEHFTKMEGILELVVFVVFLYWIWPNLFIEGASRANKMVDVFANNVFHAFSNREPAEGEQDTTRASLNSLKRYSTEHKCVRAAMREEETKMKESYLYAIKEEALPVLQPKYRPLMGLSCCSCAPVSRGSLVNNATKFLPLKNILHEYPALTKNGTTLHRTFAHLSQVHRTKSFDYPQVAGQVFEDDRMRNAIDKTAAQQFYDSDSAEEEYFQQLRKNNAQRARNLLKDMRSTMSDFLLKFTSWVLYKLLPCFLNAVVVHSGQINMLKEASGGGLPLIFLPLHRSHLDYIMISFILQNNSIRCPLIAAGDNLRMPFFGSLLRGLGAFYIKRRIDPMMGQKDHVYKAVLHSYMNSALRAGHNLEFFLEGGRTRTGKPLMPKYGIFSVVLDAFMDGTIEDALLVPVSLNYDKLVDGNFIREQLGQPKQMETFGSAIRGIWQVLISDYGMARVDFNQPFSLRELVKAFNNGVIHNNMTPVRKLQSNPSTNSLYGTDIVSDDLKHLVEKISKHIIYDCVRSTSVMSTHAVAFLLMHKFRKGAKLEELIAALDELRDDLKQDGKDIGFTGDSLDVIMYSVEMLGPGLIKKVKANNETIIKPISELPSRIELNYYSNTLTAYYALESVVALALHSLDITTDTVTESNLVDACLDLCEILQYEFIFCRPCQDLEVAIYDCIEHLIAHKEVFVNNNLNKSSLSWDQLRRNQKIAEQFMDGEVEVPYPAKIYRINYDKEGVRDYLGCLRGMLMPLVEGYSVAAFCLEKLIGRTLLENELVRVILDEMKFQLDVGTLKYEECVSSDSVKNAFKVFQKWDVLECYNENKCKLYYLEENHDNDQSVTILRNRLDKYRYGFRE